MSARRAQEAEIQEVARKTELIGNLLEQDDLWVVEAEGNERVYVFADHPAAAIEKAERVMNERWKKEAAEGGIEWDEECAFRARSVKRMADGRDCIRFP